jgi:purine catabolism regulator
MLVQTNDLDKAVQLTIDVFENHGEKFMFRRKSDHLVLLHVSDSSADGEAIMKQLAEEMIRRFAKSGPKDASLVIGSGSTVRGVAAIAESAKQARYALLFSRYLTKAYIPFKDLGAYQLFIQLKDNGADLTTYYMGVLGPLLEYDATHHSNLIKTFETYIENNLKGQKTADALFIHRHTLSYRLEQIKKKTGKDVHLANERIQLHLAVMAYRIDRMLELD